MPKQPRSTLPVLLLTLMLCLPGCVDRPSSDSWVQPIYFHDESIQWLNQHQPWPETLKDDLGQIYLHNKKCQELLP